MRRLSDRLRQLERGMTLSFQVDLDEDGFLDKECPNDGCLFAFKVHADDWRDICRDEAIFCPLCGHQAPSDQWWTTEQVETARSRGVDQVRAEVISHVDALFRDMARDFNRSASRGGLVSMRMEHQPTHRRKPVLDPRLPSRETFGLKIQCDECRARVAVVGSAFFCPACGHSSAERLFDEALAKVRLKVAKAPEIEEALARAGERDEGVILARTLRESGLGDCVVALQRLGEQLYRRFEGRKPPAKNAFQRLSDLDRLWAEASSRGLDHWLSEDERRRLNVFYQRRHLLAHTDGIVDAAYVAKSDDDAWREGQRIVISGADVLELARLVEAIAAGMRGSVPGA